MTDDPTRDQLIAEIAALKREAREREAAVGAVRRSIRGDDGAVIAEAVPDIITRVDRELRYTYANAAAEELSGIPGDAFIGRRSIILRTPGCEHVEVAYRTVFERGAAMTVEYSMNTPAGPRTFQSHMVPDYDADGAIAGVISVARDVTALRDAEEALRKSRSEFEALAENATDVIMRFDMNLDTVYANAALAQVTGRPVEESLGRPPRLLTRPNGEGERWRRRFEEILQGGEPVVVEYDVATDDGLRYFQSNLVPERNEAGEVVSLLSIARDITPLMEAEQALRVSEGRLRELLRNLPIGVALLRAPDWHIELANSAAERIGVRAGPRAGTEVLNSFAAAVDEDGNQVPLLERPVPRAIRTGLPARGQVMGYRQSDGAIRWMLVDAHPVRDDAGDVRDVIVTFTDITERKESERLLRESESGFRALVQAVPSPMWIQQDGEAGFVNDALVRLTGYPRRELARAEVFRGLFNEADRALIARHSRALLAGEPVGGPYEVTLLPASGPPRTLELTDARITRGAHQAVLICAFDLTDRKRAEEERMRLDLQVQHAQKLESLGVLAGGIAHDFNNLLVAILGNASLALLELPPDSRARQTVEAIETAAQRAADLTRQMLAYSGKGRFVIEPLNLSRLVEEMAHLLRVAVSRRAALTYDFAHDGPLVDGDATQLRQVVMNLITNASDAIGDGEGSISLATGARFVSAQELGETYLESELEEGTYAFIEVRDTGVGMDEETRQRIFEPFFSTKFTGRGLGLAAVLGIVRGHRGAITIASTPGKGSTFRVFLPLSEATTTNAAGDQTADIPKDALSGCTVLVVDDDDTVRGVASALLTRLGARVVPATNARMAITEFASRQGAVDLVLLDVMMPLMDGEATFAELRAIDPDVRVVLMSGYSEPDAARQFGASRPAGFLQKPFRGPELLACVQGVIEG